MKLLILKISKSFLIFPTSTLNQHILTNYFKYISSPYKQVKLHIPL